MFCQTIGCKPRRKSAAPTIYICPSCVLVMGIKQPPPEWDFFNFAAYHMIRNLVGAHRPEVQEALSRMFELVIEHEGEVSNAEIVAELPSSEVLPPLRRLKSAS